MPEVNAEFSTKLLSISSKEDTKTESTPEPPSFSSLSGYTFFNGCISSNEND